MTKLDILAFGAHPDDIELCTGGLLAKMARQGRWVGAVDLTRGEGASRGTVAEREQEAQTAAQILGLAVRENLALPDLQLQDTVEFRLRVAEVIRRYRADLILAPYWGDRHPDHAATSQLVTAGAFYARLPRIETGHPPYSPRAVLYYLLHENVPPTFIVDISEVFEQKMQAIAAYQSQFGRAMPAGYRFIGTSDYLAETEARARYFGTCIHTRYGEAYLLKEALRVDDPLRLLRGEEGNQP
jgi:bacillithiol biosynthesis deacetylase BshB1